ncbi:hypothetical protein BaRGS_00022602, partial [Batillaria attramentaria]
IPANRTCADAGIPQEYCVCVNTRKVNTSSPIAKKAGAALIATVNAALPKDKCHLLQLNRVTEAVEILGEQEYLRRQCPSFGNETVNSETVGAFGLGVTVAARPGDALFEAIMLWCYSTSDFVMIGDLQRIDRYGNSSYCVHDIFLKQVCLCKKF